MKKIIFIISIVLLLCGCKKMNISKIDSLKIIKQNRDNINSVQVIRFTELGSFCYDVDSLVAYNLFNNIYYVKEEGIRVTDDGTTYIFNINEKGRVVLNFEGNYLIYNNHSYLLDGFHHLNVDDMKEVSCE